MPWQDSLNHPRGPYILVPTFVAKLRMLRVEGDSTKGNRLFEDLAALIMGVNASRDV